MIRLRINGIEEEVAAATLSELLSERGIGAGDRFIAVAVNGAVVRRTDWQARALGPGDAVEIVRPLQGG
jgi:sulfur carrier protein